MWHRNAPHRHQGSNKHSSLRYLTKDFSSLGRRLPSQWLPYYGRFRPRSSTLMQSNHAVRRRVSNNGLTFATEVEESFVDTRVGNETSAARGCSTGSLTTNGFTWPFPSVDEKHHWIGKGLPPNVERPSVGFKRKSHSQAAQMLLDLSGEHRPRPPSCCSGDWITPAHLGKNYCGERCFFVHPG